MLNDLFVMYGCQLVGRFTPDANLRLSFVYDEAWLGRADAFALSISLPLQTQAHEYPHTNIFLENLLPEAELRLAIERAFQLPKDSPYDFLKDFGKDVIGAFSLVAQPVTSGQPGARIKLPLAAIDGAIDQGISVYQSVIYEHGAKFSLAGAQDKFCCIYQAGELFLNTGALASTHIAKVNLDFRNSQTVYNELFCMRLAEQVGLSVPKVELIEEKHPILIIERFDRRTQEGITVRLHQEDFCQALSIPSVQKYEDKGGPTAAQNFALIKQYSSQPLSDLEAFLDWLAFNLIIGNNDSHSKNLSWLYLDGQLRLAPFYDLLSTEVYGNRFSRSFAFSIGGTSQFDKIRQSHIDRFERSLGVNHKTFLKRLAHMAQRVEQQCAVVLKQMQTTAPQATVVQRVSELIHKRLRHFRGHGGLDI